ncbi:MAG: response regulator [Polyangiaceae bacterium]|jgi:two-component system chemotaxis response regulator CheY
MGRHVDTPAAITTSPARNFAWGAPYFLNEATRTTERSGLPEGSTEARRRDLREADVIKKVLVVDDSSTVRQQVGVALAKGGYELVDACDGIDGLAKFSANPDLAMVICDVNMPRMDGIEMLSTLAERCAGKMIPVIMLTTEVQPRLIERARKAGAQGWLIKPFKTETLIAAVRKLVGDSS